jgi:membrane-associated protease RseP (regulator of RpoE activity)
MKMLNLWLLSAVSFLAGILVGVLVYMAAERHAREQEALAPAAASAAETAAPVATPRVPAADERTAPAAVGGEDQWQAVDEALLTLDERLSALEARLSDPAPDEAESIDAEAATPAGGGVNEEVLVAAGVDPGLAADILSRRSQLEMQRLELRDQASRGGWINSERFAEELRQLEGNVGALREEIGDDAYDRFLYLTGQPNRVVVASVIEESPAQRAGLEAGDVVLGYAGSRVFSYPDLLNATRGGERGEYVVLSVQRNGETLELTFPRGPLGIRLDSDRVDPDANT